LTTPCIKDSLIFFVSKLLKVSRRWFLKASAALGGWTAFAAMPVFTNMPSTRQSKSAKSESKPAVAVVGAGAFGGWTALYLLRRGARVTLIDAWGPGNSRASSGGETRIIRGTYGPNQPYTKMAARALQLWQENQKRWNRVLFRRMGVLWMVAHEDDSFEKGSLPMLKEAGIPFAKMNYNDLSRTYPQVNFDGVRWAIFEPESGGLMAREACAAVRDAFVAEGGKYVQGAVLAPRIAAGELQGLDLQSGLHVGAQHYVFACGPWLGNMFPDVIGEKIRPTRQEVFFFGTAAGDVRFNPENMPIWVDHGERFFYGFPVVERRGFKIADDTRGPMFDPTNGQRVASAEGLASAREHLGLRFPMLKHAPLIESRVCQYENSPDQNFIMDRHPRAANVWLLGGGSGHGFKHGPAVGEMVAEMVVTEKIPNPLFELSRFK
jgi:glycine/D-amino acid oxidase-like deaminating enzyme